MSNLHLPECYVENPPASHDSIHTYWNEAEQSLADQWQVPVYKFAARLSVGRHVIDIGCGTGGKLDRYIRSASAQTIGVDQSSGIEIARRRKSDTIWIEGDLDRSATWELTRQAKPDLALCVDVVEHLPDPVSLLRHLHNLDTLILISTPDRARMEGASELGPPTNQLHIREWNRDEFADLLQDVGFQIFDQLHRNPRGAIPMPLHARMIVSKLARGKRPYYQRTDMVFVVRPTTGSESKRRSAS